MRNNFTMRGISRVDPKNRNGYWIVRVFYSVRKTGENGKPEKQKIFTDTVYGSTGKALDAAIEYRNQLYKEKYGEDFEKYIKKSFGKGSKEFYWKNRSTKMRRRLQKKVSNKRTKIIIGTGIEGAKKAYDLGMGKTTCEKVKRGDQDWVYINSGGWRKSKIEDLEIVYEPSTEDYEKIKEIVFGLTDDFPDYEQYEICQDILIEMATSEEQITEENIKRICFFFLKKYSLKKNQKGKVFPASDLIDRIHYA